MKPLRIMLIGGKDQECKRLEKLISSLEPRPCEICRILRMEQAAEELTYGRYHLVFLCIRSSGQSELKLLREISALKPRVPVVVLIEEDQSEIGRKAQELGAVGYITKDCVNAEFVRFALDCVDKQTVQTPFSPPPQISKDAGDQATK